MSKPVTSQFWMFVDAQTVRAAGKAPGDRIVPCRTAARLQQAADDGEPRIVAEIQHRRIPPNLFPVQQLGIDAVQAHRVAAPGIGVHLRIAMGQVQNPRCENMTL